jgi:hypothetical protein
MFKMFQKPFKKTFERRKKKKKIILEMGCSKKNIQY